MKVFGKMIICLLIITMAAYLPACDGESDCEKVYNKFKRCCDGYTTGKSLIVERCESLMDRNSSTAERVNDIVLSSDCDEPDLQGLCRLYVPPSER